MCRPQSFSVGKVICNRLLFDHPKHIELVAFRVGEDADQQSFIVQGQDIAQHFLNVFIRHDFGESLRKQLVTRLILLARIPILFFLRSNGQDP